MTSHQTPPTTITKIYHSALPLGLLAGFVYLVNLFESYDWGHPEIKFLAYLTMFAAVLILSKAPKAPPISALTTKLELVVLTVLLVIIIMSQAPTIIPLLTKPAEVDVGQITDSATIMLFKDYDNPYAASFARYGDDPKYWGYKYGSIMLVGFGLNAISSPLGLKLSALIYTILAVIVLGLLALNTKKLSHQSLATLLFAVTALLAHNLFLDEIFRATVIDILPTTLLLAALLSTRRRLWLLAGLLVGLSVSAKFAPAIFFIWLFIRRRPNWRFFGGVSVGLLPTIPFLLWDANSFIANVFTFVLIKPPDSTSLQAVLAGPLHFIPSAVFLASALLFLFINFHQPINHRRLAVHFTLLLIIAAAMYREVHNNHLIFSLPFIALVLAWYRHRLNYVVQKTFTWLTGTCPQ